MKAKIITLSAIFLLLIHIPVVSASEIRGVSVLAETNQVRVSQNLKPLIPAADLVKAAQARADDMARLHYFSHRSPTGKRVWDFIGMRTKYTVAGENLAKGFNDTDPLIKTWVTSPTHYANIIDKSYRYTGIGIARDGDNILIVQFFAK